MPGGKRVHLAAMDHVDLHRWFLAMDSATRVDDGPKPSGSDDGYVSLVASNVEMPSNVEVPVEVPKKEVRVQSTTEAEGEVQVSE